MPVSLLLTLLMAQAAPAPAPATEPAATPVPDVEVVREVRQGSVELECTVLSDGQVERCRVLSETPRGQGFGAAALNAARRARLSPQSAAGVAPGGKVRFRTTFQLPNPPAA